MSLDGSISKEELDDVFDVANPPSIGAERGARFWLIIISLLVATLLAALDLTAIPTALPTITDQLTVTADSASFVWIGAAYTLTSTAPTVSFFFLFFFLFFRACGFEVI
jgi:hypothetical protein